MDWFSSSSLSDGDMRSKPDDGNTLAGDWSRRVSWVGLRSESSLLSGPASVLVPDTGAERRCRRKNEVSERIVSVGRR